MPIDRSPPPATKSVEEHRRVMAENFSVQNLQISKRPRESDSPPAPASAHQDNMLAEVLQTVRKTQSDLDTLTIKFNEIESPVAYNSTDIV